MMANISTLKETVKTIQELKLIMRIYSRWSGITDVTIAFQASVDLFTNLSIKEF